LARRDHPFSRQQIERQVAIEKQLLFGKARLQLFAEGNQIVIHLHALYVGWRY